jgi:large subunit ribosomal protein L6
MSRVGNNPISIPEGVSVDVQSDVITVKGKLGELSQSYDTVKITQEGTTLKVSRPSESKPHRAKHGLYRALVNNMVEGVSQGFQQRIRACRCWI